MATNLTIQAVTEHPTASTLDSNDPHTFTHVNTGNDPGTVVVLISSVGAGAPDDVAGVTYGGSAMTRVRSDASTDGDEDGRTYIYILSGASLPTGDQTVSIDKTPGATTWAACITIDEELVVTDHDGTGNVQANPSVTLTNPNEYTGMIFGVIFSGQNATTGVTAITDAAGSITHLVFAEIDVGNQVVRATRTNQIHDDSFVFGWTMGSEDCAFSAVYLTKSSVGQVSKPNTTVQGARTLAGASRHAALSDNSDDTYVAGNSATDDICGIEDLVNPNVDTGHILWVRNSGSAGTGTGTLELWQGDPTAGGVEVTDFTGLAGGIEPPGDFGFDIPELEAANITDYADLYIRYSKPSGTASRVVREVWLEVPAAPSGGPIIVMMASA